MSVIYLTSSVNNEHAVSHPKTHIFEMIIFEEEEKEKEKKGEEILIIFWNVPGPAPISQFSLTLDTESV